VRLRLRHGCAFVRVFDDDDNVSRLIQPDQAVASNSVDIVLSAAASATTGSPQERWAACSFPRPGSAALPGCRLARRMD
jgi:hypothetical protein